MEKIKNTKELREVLSFDDKENYLLVPNEVIEILKESELKDARGEHIAVAYSYLYLTTWMYRYAKYSEINLLYTTTKGLKNILGLSPTSVSYNYIIKKNGLLDELGLTRTESFTEAPVQWEFSHDDKEFIDFTLFNELSDDLQKTMCGGHSVKRRQIKYPVLALESITPYDDDFESSGAFFGGGKERTHRISFEAFMKCVTTEDLGVIGFYLYSFIRSRYGNGKNVQISIKGIVRESGLAETTVVKYLKLLREYELIGAKVECYVVGRYLGSGIETEVIRFRNQRRRARLAQLPHTLTADEWEESLEYFNNECAYCGDSECNLEQEHIIPVSKGGGYTADNIIPACRACNASKKDRDLEEWYSEQEFFNIGRFILLNEWIEAGIGEGGAR